MLTPAWIWLLENLINTYWRDVAIASLIFLLVLLARGIFTRFVFHLILNLTRKTSTNLDTNILMAFEGPLKSFFFVFGAYLALLYLPISAATTDVATTILRSFIIFFVAWGLSNLFLSPSFQEISSKFNLDSILVNFFSKIIRWIVVVLAVLMIAQQWGFDVNGFIAGLGLGGLAFALAAKDALANIFGGIVVLTDKPFSVGDWILTPSVEGTVEEINFRSTKIRTFAHALVTLPNSVIANEPITNWSRMGKRRITFNLEVTYDTSPQKLNRCIERIRELLETHPGIHQETIFVCFDQFGKNGLEIFLYFFTVSTVWAEYLEVKEEINFRILEILEEEQVKVAFPRRGIYIKEPASIASAMDNPDNGVN